MLLCPVLAPKLSCNHDLDIMIEKGVGMDTMDEHLSILNKHFMTESKNMTLPMATQYIIKVLRTFYPKEEDEVLYEKILFKTNPSLSFPKSDIQDIIFQRKKNDIYVDITLNYLGIFGASSPLPAHYSEKVLEDRAGKRILYDILDMLNHPLKKMLYPIWEKQRYYIRYHPNIQDTFSKYLASIFGLREVLAQKEDAFPELDLHKLFAFGSILSMHHQTSSTLQAFLQHYFDYDHITIVENIVTKTSLPEDQRATLGYGNNQLGTSMNIGTFLLSRTLAYRIVFHDVPWEDLPAFGAHGKIQSELKTLLNALLKTPLKHEAVVVIKQNKIRPCIMGETMSIGSQSWIGNVQEDQAITL